jgi:hypothetical protein
MEGSVLFKLYTSIRTGGHCITRTFLNPETNIVRVIKTRIRWAGHVAPIRERRDAYRSLVSKPQGKKGPVRRPKHRWKADIALDLQEIRWEGMDWINLAHYRANWRAIVDTDCIKFGEMSGLPEELSAS